MNNTILTEVYAATLAHIAALEADKRTDHILAWDYGLGVKFANGRAIAVRLYEACSIANNSRNMKAISAIEPYIANGNGVKAEYMRRDRVIAAYLPSLRQQATQIKIAIDQHAARARLRYE